MMRDAIYILPIHSFFYPSIHPSTHGKSHSELYCIPVKSATVIIPFQNIQHPNDFFRSINMTSSLVKVSKTDPISKLKCVFLTLLENITSEVLINPFDDTTPSPARMVFV